MCQVPEIVKLKKNEKLSLVNDGNLSLFWIGTGSAFSKVNYQNNLLIIKGNTHILVDCGTKCTQALFEYGISVSNINNILITHSHADHIGGLEEFALVSKYFKKQKPFMIITKEYEEILWNDSLKGGSAYNERNNKKYLEFEDFFKVIRPVKLQNEPRPLFNVDFDDINIKLFPTMHIPDSANSWVDSFLSYGLIIEDKILFTSDTRFDKSMINEFTSDNYSIEHIFHDCQLFKGGVHASYEELLTLPENIRSMIYLVHYGDNSKDFNPEKDGFRGFAKAGSYYNFK